VIVHFASRGIEQVEPFSFEQPVTHTLSAAQGDLASTIVTT
jgi:hypothetical protein